MYEIKIIFNNNIAVPIVYTICRTSALFAIYFILLTNEEVLVTTVHV